MSPATNAPPLPRDAWGFLTTPLHDLLDAANATTRTVEPRPRFLGGIFPAPNGHRLDLPGDLAPLERDIVARGLLAAWYGIDTTNWPTPLAITPEVAR
ncbi:hypothetical protein RM780_03875 [Streptomyces sp. DSM 44917]|uniref:Uncharacterized protein n=1 Tax=Streptomyces boetiae TaxID=3075541 RepID=A0ABU2L3V6_9ACTN|nr:hypothetical protein [Streptomyces sp. DSM 44917]MDT0306101.1 hypothetical protein [Streptomyces sp. DSM 44917]